MQSDEDARPVCVASDELNAQSCSFIDDTCYSMDFLGLTHLPEQGTGVRVGVIDSAISVLPAKKGSSSTSAPAKSDFDGFSRKPVVKLFHDCNQLTKLSHHGILCASILGGKIRDADFFGAYEGQIHGGVPSAELFIYGVGCTNCRIEPHLILNAFKAAIKDGVSVISMSQSESRRILIKNILDDNVGLSTLNAFGSGILVCLSAGNRGPLPGTLTYGMPWCLNVGAITMSRTLIAEVEIGIIFDVPEKVKKVGVLYSVPDAEIKHSVQGVRIHDVHVIATLEGVSCNVFEESFCKLRVSDLNMKAKECILTKDKKSNTINLISAEEKHRGEVLLLNPSNVFTSITEESCKKLLKLRIRLGYPDIYVRISRSKVKIDDRGVYVPDFSARGPSLLYEDTITPDVAAPGYAILSSFPQDQSIFLSKKRTPLYNDQRIASGTSMATPHVAAQIAKIKSHRPTWNPSILKSAAITTARSLAAEGIPGNEFAFGAGIIQVDKAIDPGLVYEETHANFERYARTLLRVYDLNLPSFAASFGTSPDYVQRVFNRTLTNIGAGSAKYKAEIQVFHNSLDPNVSIKICPDMLQFGSGQKQSFAIVVRVLPRPGGSCSALLKWVHHVDDDETTHQRHDVNSPIQLYHKNAYQRKLEYVSDR